MHYISTRNNHVPVESAKAIMLGMVPEGGLFVPQSIPSLDINKIIPQSYHQTAHAVLAHLLTDYTNSELDKCIHFAYNSSIFDTESVIELASLDQDRSIMELWHGPTAAFKDVALQIMPHFMAAAKRKIGETNHTIILVATSGDTGKAALEGFRGCKNISIIVFYPRRGVSEIQKHQMITTEGNNTHVIAVKGNFDDCQNGVKALFADERFSKQLKANGYVLSSANSINWGRLCPQIVYYVYAYSDLVRRGVIEKGTKINFCVPTGNFGNILAGYYAKRMGVPIAKLLCASNMNKILNDFFETGVYDRNRKFYRTMSPSMDILISSNLERFLFEITGHDSDKISRWYKQLSARGKFEVDAETKQQMDSLILPGWIDEEATLEAIGQVYRKNGYLIDPHTAVAVAMCSNTDTTHRHTVIASTASPYKFSGNVIRAIGGEKVSNEFQAIDELHRLTKAKLHVAVTGIGQRPIRHTRTIEAANMKKSVLDIFNKS